MAPFVWGGAIGTRADDGSYCARLRSVPAVYSGALPLCNALRSALIFECQYFALAFSGQHGSLAAIPHGAPPTMKIGTSGHSQKTVAPQAERSLLELVRAMDFIISAEVVPVAGKATEAARNLQHLGFQILSLDKTISVQGPQSLWISTFHVRFEERSRPALGGLLDEKESYQKAMKSTLRVPSELRGLIEEVEFIEPPEMF